MEALHRLTRRQVETLQAVGALASPDRGAALNDLAARLRLSAPSALAHLGPLETEGLVVRHRGKTRLSSKGARCLAEYQRHHRVVESLFGQLGFLPEETCAAAREVDLAISHRTVEKLCLAERHPTECPHGQPISPCGSSSPPRDH